MYLETIVFLNVYIHTQLYLLLALAMTFILIARDFVVYACSSEAARMMHGQQATPVTTNDEQYN